MKVVLYMALTANGMIARSNGDSSWTSQEDIEGFLTVCKQAGVAIMGRHTYDYLTTGEHPEGLFLKNGLHVVLTSRTEAPVDKTVLFLNQAPQQALRYLEKKGYQEVCLVGGATTVTAFFREKLIDGVYFDIEPLLFGKGLSLLSNCDIEESLTLLDTRKINENTVQLHYRVNK